MHISSGWALLLFFVLGWTYYMVATILMKGSIFVPFRAFISAKAERNKVFHWIQSMLGCLMCTATEAALWTLGLSTFIVGVGLSFPEVLVGSFLEREIQMSVFANVVLMAMISFALSLAVAGEAWAIKTVVEHREEAFLRLRETYRLRETELLEQVTQLASMGDQAFQNAAASATKIISFDEFKKIFEQLPRNEKCRSVWCPYSRTTCYVREMQKGIASWWKTVNGDRPGMEAYEQVLQNAIRVENKFYWGFWVHGTKPPREVYEGLVEQVNLVLSGGKPDQEEDWH